MEITVNGTRQEFAGEQLTLSAVLTEQKVESPEMVAVQVNGVFVDKSEFDSQLLREGDSVEFLYFMGGGAR